MEFLEEKAKVKVYGQEVELDIPSHRQTIQYLKEVKDLDGDLVAQEEVAFRFVENLGMPTTLLDRLKTKHLRELISFLMKGTN